MSEPSHHPDQWQDHKSGLLYRVVNQDGAWVLECGGRGDASYWYPALDVYAAAARIATLAAQLAEAQAENGRLAENLRIDALCDGCLGRPDDRNCGCGGTGRMSEMVVHLRVVALVEQPQRIADLVAENARLRSEVDGLRLLATDGRISGRMP